MSGKKERELIEKLGKISPAPIQVFPATVASVDEENNTIDVVDAYDSEFFNVRLKASINNEASRVIMIPEIESTVLVGLIGNNENALYLVKPSAVNKLYADIAGTTIQIDADGVIINEAENGPVLISQSLINDLNSVKQDLNDLKTVFSTWVVVATDGGAALKAAAATWAGSQLSDTALDDVTNDKLQH
jgi:hypothetical protein